MRLKLPAAIERETKKAYDRLEEAFAQVASREETIDRVLFRDSDGVAWSVSVTTAGVLTVAAISGKTRDI